MLRKLLTIFTVTTLLLAVSICNLADDSQTYGPTTENDHLWYIAQQVRPSRDVSKQQTMVAILKANPDAFISNNVNGLRAGYHLKIPNAADIKAIPPVSALIQISAQNTAWMNRVDFDAPTTRNGAKAPPFGTLRHSRQATGLQVHQSFTPPADPGEVIASSDNPSMKASTGSSITSLEPSSDVSAESQSPLSSYLQGRQHVMSDFLPTGSLNNPLTDFIQATLASNDLSARVKPLITLNTPIIQALTSALQSNSSATSHPDLMAHASASSSGFITAQTAETLIKNGIATHINNLSQKLDDFLIKFNQLDQYAKQRLDVIEDEHVAMKNQIASLDKQMQQLRENYLQYSTPVVHRSAFSEYGIWIMGSSVLACLLVLISTLSRRRRAPEPEPMRVTPRDAAKALLSEAIDIEIIEDEYDYLGSREGISAKLDLARAYVDMGDTSQASQVLNEVIAHGNDEQRYTARKILADIIRDTVH
jgi:FimV-like protein